jgi:hypothetical protein
MTKIPTQIASCPGDGSLIHMDCGHALANLTALTEPRLIVKGASVS